MRPIFSQHPKLFLTVITPFLPLSHVLPDGCFELARFTPFQPCVPCLPNHQCLQCSSFPVEFLFFCLESGFNVLFRFSPPFVAGLTLFVFLSVPFLFPEWEVPRFRECYELPSSWFQTPGKFDFLIPWLFPGLVLPPFTLARLLNYSLCFCGSPPPHPLWWLFSRFSCDLFFSTSHLPV